MLTFTRRAYVYAKVGTIIASQFEPAEWLDQIPVPVAAEAITDRLCSQAYKIVIKDKKSTRATARV